MLIDRLSDEEQETLLTFLPPTLSADILTQMHGSQAVDILDGIAAEQAKEIIQELDSDAAVDLLGLLEEAEAEAILQLMEPEEAADARKLLGYDEDTAGGLMRHEYLSYSLSSTVGDVIEDLRKMQRNIPILMFSMLMSWMKRSGWKECCVCGTFCCQLTTLQLPAS